jgi:phosphate-selective porin OprO/OprP
MALKTLKKIKRSHVIGILLRISLLLMVILPFRGFSQDTVKKVPDGTEGETLDAKGSTFAKNKAWNEFDLGFTTFKIGLGFLYEYGGFSQDATGKQQMDLAKATLSNGFDVRDSRLLFGGQLDTKRLITWKAGFMYDGSERAWYVRESGVLIAVPELWGSFFVGRTKEGISMSKVMNGYSGEGLERTMVLDPIPILADGVKWLGYLEKPRIFWNAGVFTDWLSKGQSFSTYTWQVVARVGWLPIHDDKSNLHIAASFRIGHPISDSIRVRSRPEANNAPFFIDAGKFPTDQSTYTGGEVYYSTGSWWFGSEFYWDSFKSSTKDNPVFFGGDLMASYVLTGESRPYMTTGAIYGFVPVKRSVFKGGPGAWEVVLRYSTFDLNSGLISGGKFWRITPVVNWYLSGNFRFAMAYGYGVLDRFDLKGATNFFQSRLQVMF